MLNQFPVMACIPVTDMERAKKFYGETLGLTAGMADGMGGQVFTAGGGTGLYLYKRGPSTADHTLAGWRVDDIEAEVADLVAKGIAMEEYHTDQIDTENGIATWDEEKAAWFKDPDGNILSLGQGPK
jgi:catechol 2,3-dioxygenase-like lactoylglutathione lyase family enzyme